MKKSFFGKYCLYKLKGFRGLAIAAAVLNFAALVFPAAFFYFSLAEANKWHLPSIYLDETWLYYITFCVIAAASAILVITPAISFKYYNSRAAMDTLGCLPLNYSERFRGDFLSGLTANLISFIPFTAIGAVIVAVMQNTVIKEIQAWMWTEYNKEFFYSDIKDNFLKAYLGFVLLLLLGYIGTYVISTFVTSCCGRAGSSIFYSVLALVVPAGIVSTFGTCVLNGAVGVIVEEEIENALMVIAPAGLWLGTGLRLMYGYDGLAALTYIVDNPVCIVIAFLVTAAFLVWAYFLGKHRKAERVDRDFVYNGAYHVIALALSATIIGFYFTVSPTNAEAFTSGNVQQILISIAVGLVIYVVMELVHTRSAKKLPISLLRYAALYAVCFGFLFIAHKTDSFGIEKRLPDKDSISSIEVEGDFFYSPTGESFVYRSESAIDTILSEHEKLIQNRDSLTTGSTVTISYVMNNGLKLRRQYSSGDGTGRELIKAFSDEVKKNEVSEGGLGFLDDQHYDELVNIKCDMNHNYNSNARETFYVRLEASTELFEALRYDLLNNFEQYQYSTIGHITISYKLNGIEREAYYSLNEKSDRTIAVIESNRIDDTLIVDDEEFNYYIRYSVDLGEETPVISSLSLDLQNTDNSELARAVKEFIAERKYVPEEERSECWTIMSGSPYKEFCVRKADEYAMLKAVLKISAEMSRSE